MRITKAREIYDTIKSDYDFMNNLYAVSNGTIDIHTNLLSHIYLSTILSEEMGLQNDNEMIVFMDCVSNSVPFDEFEQELDKYRNTKKCNECENYDEEYPTAFENMGFCHRLNVWASKNDVCKE